MLEQSSIKREREKSNCTTEKRNRPPEIIMNVLYFSGISLVLCQCLLLTTSSSDDGKDACAEFRDKSCSCEEGGRRIECSNFEASDPIYEFPLKGIVLETFTTM